MLTNHYYDPYRSVPEINKSVYFNYQQQPSYQNNIQHQQSAIGPKWASQYQVGQHQPPTTYLERESSGESYYSNESTVLPKLKNATPTPKKMLTSSFAENTKTKSRSPQRIYKTHSDLNKEKSRKKGILKDETEFSPRKEQDLSTHLKKEIDDLNRKHSKNDSSLAPDILNQILKKTQSIETNVLVVNHKLMLLENKVETVISNQNKLLSKIDHIERDIKHTTGLSPELLKEIKDALNIDFDIDLEIKPDEKINKYSINSIKAYKSHGASD